MKGRFPPAIVLILALVVPALNLIPTAIGYAGENPPDRVFLGFPVMPQDHFQYATFIRQASEDGRFLMENLFTGEEQRGVYVMLYYWALGTASRFTGLSHIQVWNAGRVAGGALYVILFWALTAHFMRTRRGRIVATVLFCFAGGIDWMVALARRVWPAAGLLEEPFGSYWNWSTFGTMSVPNWIWPAALMVLAWHLLLRRPDRPAWWGLPILPAIWFMHHHSAMVAYLAFGIFPFVPALRGAATLRAVDRTTVLRRIRTVLPVLISFGLVAAYLLWARTDEVFRANAAGSLQWRVFFSPWWYPITYGLLLPVAWLGLRRAASSASVAWDACLAWLLSSLVLSWNPITGGAKYQFLVFPPLVLLAAEGIAALAEDAPDLARRLRHPVAAAGIGACLFLNAPVSLLKPQASEFDRRTAYAPAPDLAAMRWLADQPRGLVLSSYASGHLIPWLSGQKVFVGHWFMTIDQGIKQRNAAAFYAPQVPTEPKREFLRSIDADYVYFGSAEARAGAIDPALALERIYEADGVAIYRVIH